MSVSFPIGVVEIKMTACDKFVTKSFVFSVFLIKMKSNFLV